MNFAFQTRYLTNRQKPITCSVIGGTKFFIDFFLNPLHPNISMHILLTTL